MNVTHTIYSIVYAYDTSHTTAGQKDPIRAGGRCAVSPLVVAALDRLVHQSIA